ncbi:MAG: mechanosensitive ion channel family protein [Acidobacteriota bacterium]
MPQEPLGALSAALTELLTPERITALIGSVLIFLIGLVVARVVSFLVARPLKRPTDVQRVILIRRVVFYSVLLFFTLTALRQAGLNLDILLGAAGILTVALGFAAQTSVSNLISGLFLLAERPFSIGDLVTIDDVTGEILSIDWLSVKIRKFDNVLVRIPNETVLKTKTFTATRYPIRRVDMMLSLDYATDLRQAVDVLKTVTDSNPLALDEPRPVFFFRGFDDNCITLQFSAWTFTKNYFTLKNELFFEIKEAFDKSGIQFPFPQRTITFATDEPPQIPIREDYP